MTSHLRHTCVTMGFQRPKPGIPYITYEKFNFLKLLNCSYFPCKRLVNFLHNHDAYLVTFWSHHYGFFLWSQHAQFHFLSHHIISSVSSPYFNPFNIQQVVHSPQAYVHSAHFHWYLVTFWSHHYGFFLWSQFHFLSHHIISSVSSPYFNPFNIQQVVHSPQAYVHSAHFHW